MSKLLFAALALAFFSLTWSVPAASSNLLGLDIYSDMTVNTEEDDVNGLQIILIPSDQGDQLLWRSAGGLVAKSLLLGYTQKGNVIRVTVPADNDNFGEWVLTLGSASIHATGPRGLHYDLRRVKCP